MELQDRITYAIKTAGMSQSEIAGHLGISRSAVSQWCNGGVSDLKMEYLFGLARKTGFNAEWIALGKGAERPLPHLRGLSRGAEKILSIWQELNSESKRITISTATLQRFLQRQHDGNNNDGQTIEDAIDTVMSEIDENGDTQ